MERQARAHRLAEKLLDLLISNGSFKPTTVESYFRKYNELYKRALLIII